MSKRPRIPSPSPSPTHSASSPTTKATRVVETSVGSHPLLCTLPPTCHRKPTPIANVKDLESHYAIYHAHVCEEPGCLCVFPEERLLELHQTECHDTLAAIRKEKGEKIFACHLPPTTCNRVFQTPKARRLHLIQVHGYPKEYFFAVTNKGVGGLLKKWGEGASMIRGQWKPREDEVKDQQIDEQIDEEPYDEEDLDGEDTAIEDQDITNPVSQRSSSDVDNLAQSMDALSLVPSSVRFGRGGQKHVGFAPRVPEYHQRGIPMARPGRGRAIRGRSFVRSAPMDIVPSRGRGMPRGMLHVARGGGVPPRGGFRGRSPIARLNAGWMPRGRARGRGI